jgi:hypothetical protein
MWNKHVKYLQDNMIDILFALNKEFMEKLGIHGKMRNSWKNEKFVEKSF